MKIAPLYGIVDQRTAEQHGWSVPGLARALLAGGVRLLQLRASAAGSGELLRWCDDVVAAAQSCGATVIVNDRVDVALLAGAGGVHVGQEDMPVAHVRRLLPADSGIGISTHSPEEVDRTAREAVSYMAVGPVFRTSTKQTGRQPVGLDLVRYAARSQERPVVAIGGITLERAPEVLAAGAAGQPKRHQRDNGGDCSENIECALPIHVGEEKLGKGRHHEHAGGTHCSNYAEDAAALLLRDQLGHRAQDYDK
jgi:thiamine-phosphate pyrophosphorylase